MSTALLLMDLQPQIVDSLDDPSVLLAGASRTAQAARNAGIPVIWVRVAFRPGHPEVAGRNQMFSALSGAGRLVETEDAVGIHPGAGVAPEDLVVTKRRVSAFAGSDLDVVLRARGITRLALGGVSTSGVVLSTLRQAADLDFELVVLEDLCRDRDPEVHRVLTEKVFPRQATVTSSEDWSAAF